MELKRLSVILIQAQEGEGIMCRKTYLYNKSPIQICDVECQKFLQLLISVFSRQDHRANESLRRTKVKDTG